MTKSTPRGLPAQRDLSYLALFLKITSFHVKLDTQVAYAVAVSFRTRNSFLFDLLVVSR